ncbi:macrophage mannose receptor 1-like [Etheostoma cragini]|uniref:macrophage mannose receptor 1-like n=1 Tax=Etheostoma cragini TaxID=417921 RepID=UPI00155EAF35|nr:macrophage mannose receptor 1-like [Etheostoma cragini]
MYNVLLLIMAASVTAGLSAVSSYSGPQYYFVYERKNMTEAKRYCREKYTDLSTVYNMEDVKTLNNMADLSKMVYTEYPEYYNHRAWIGLYNDVNSWRWSLTNTSFDQPGETEFRQWRTGEPNNCMSQEHCTEMGFDGLWNDVSCERSMKAVCVHVTGPNVTFILTDISMTWPAAQNYCRQQYTDLASVRNSTENQKVQGLIPTNGSVFIGLFRDPWKWSDGSASSFRYWNQDNKEPNNNKQEELCVAADFSQLGQWEDWNCDVKRAFICVGPVPASKQVIRLRLEKKNSPDVNDQAFMEAMLKQLQQKLGARDRDIKLSWRKQADGQVFHKKKEEDELK